MFNLHFPLQSMEITINNILLEHLYFHHHTHTFSILTVFHYHNHQHKTRKGIDMAPSFSPPFIIKFVIFCKLLNYKTTKCIFPCNQFLHYTYYYNLFFIQFHVLLFYLNNINKKWICKNLLIIAIDHIFVFATLHNWKSYFYYAINTRSHSAISKIF
jgi:hypothetical protein